MPPVIVHAFALIGLLTVVASLALAVMVLLDSRGRRRAAHRKARDSKRTHELTPVA